MPGHCATRLQVVEILPIYNVDSLSVSGFVCFQQVLWLLASVLYSSDEYPLQAAVGILERETSGRGNMSLLAKHLQVPTLLKPVQNTLWNEDTSLIGTHLQILTPFKPLKWGHLSTSSGPNSTKPLDTCHTLWNEETSLIGFRPNSIVECLSCCGWLFVTVYTIQYTILQCTYCFFLSFL